jgi:hypothetical protein
MTSAAADLETEIAVLLDNICTVLRALATMPTSPDVRTLTDRALACERTVKDWGNHPPTAEAHEAMMKKILGLHTALSRLEQEPQ